MVRGLTILAALLILLALSWGRLASVELPAGIPVEALAAARDRPQPRIDLTAPLPAWIPLPDRGRIITAGLYPPQPPYGAAATLTLVIDETAEAFAAAYGTRLGQAGFALRIVAPRFNVAFDEPDLQFEAVEIAGAPSAGRVIYVSLRHTRAGRFAQLTCWEPPVPRLR